MTIIKVDELNKAFLLNEKSAGFAAGLKNILHPRYRYVEAVKVV